FMDPYLGNAWKAQLGEYVQLYKIHFACSASASQVNDNTHYFSFALYIFVEVNCEVIQEQITRVLLKCLFVNHTHPWGLLITFIEMIKNHRYNFWTCSFTRCAPEIEKLLESVSRSCGGRKTPDKRLVSDGGAH
ncbi:hypothetical protein MKW92_049150, partial [Papaver armeniacum]